MKNILLKKLARLSLCACGYPFLKIEVPLGKIYRVPRYNALGVDGSFVCGGCGNTTAIQTIMVIEDHGGVAWMPRDLFDWDERPQTTEETLKEKAARTAAIGKVGKKKTARKSRL